MDHKVGIAPEMTDTERGLSPRTIVGYQRVASLFLASCAPDPAAPGVGVQRLGVEVVNAFLLSHCVGRSVGSALNLVTALRALLRYFYVLAARLRAGHATGSNGGRRRGILYADR